MDDYTIIILVTLFGFLALAAILLVPVYRFLQREERASRRWTADGVAPSRQRPMAPAEGDSPQAGDGSAPHGEVSAAAGEASAPPGKNSAPSGKNSALSGMKSAAPSGEKSTLNEESAGSLRDAG